MSAKQCPATMPGRVAGVFQCLGIEGHDGEHLLPNFDGVPLPKPRVARKRPARADLLGDTE